MLGVKRVTISTKKYWLFLTAAIAILIPVAGFAQTNFASFFMPPKGFTQLAFLDPSHIAPSLYNGYHVQILVRNRNYVDKNYTLEISENGTSRMLQTFTLHPDEKRIIEQVIWNWPPGRMKVVLQGTNLAITAIIRGNN